MKTCVYCNKQLKTYASWDNHTKRNIPKYCLAIREKNRCSGCIKQIPFLDVETHKSACNALRHKQERQYEISQHNEERSVFKIENEKLQARIKKLESQLRRREDEMFSMKAELENQIDELKTDYKEITVLLANKETVVNNTTNNNHTTNQINQILIDHDSPLNLDPLKLQALFDSKYTSEHFNKGLKGLAEFTMEHILTNEDGNQIYLLSDINRYTFTYLGENGKIQKDKQANHLINGI
ncbi:hypothetical protein OAV62_01635 [bacterium]|nr:hypothetical protein [bacterium]